MEIKFVFHPLRGLEFLRIAAVVVLSLLAAIDRLAAEEVPINTSNWMMEATNHLGQWIWDTNTFDKQTCRFWKSFEVPAGAKISQATLRITVDNGYTLFLDGQEIGRGSDWRTVTEYDVTWLLNPGRHILAVEGFNDRLEAGLIFGLEIQLADQRVLEIFSDDTWSVAPSTLRHWASRKNPLPDWHRAVVIGSTHHHPWENWPLGFTVGLPLRPVIVHFWQAGSFQLTLFTICLRSSVILPTIFKVVIGQTPPTMPILRRSPA